MNMDSTNSPTNPDTDADLAGDVTGYPHGETHCVRPRTVAEVCELVQDARARNIPLYPFSTGFNWGYGSRAPLVSPAITVDLSEMRSIRNAEQISIDNPVAVIEPGVTQRQLYEFLEANCPELTFNVTGAGRDTSLLGNALDRGVGYTGPRREDLYGLEVVTGTGEIIHTGFRRLGEDSPLAHFHPYGLGPMLDGLFFQGNFGIVTSACFRLLPKRPYQAAVSLALRRTEDLPLFIDELARLKREGLLTSVTHIGNRARTHASMAYGIHQYLTQQCGMLDDEASMETLSAMAVVAPHEWTSLASVSGNFAQTSGAILEIWRRTRHFARLMVLGNWMLEVGGKLAHKLRKYPKARANAAAIAAMKPLHGLATGIPTDVAIDNLLWKFGRPGLPAATLDQSRCGLLFINPALPLDGTLVAQVIAALQKRAQDFDHTLYMTLNIETPTSLVAVINLLFDRAQPDQVAQAHQCANALLHVIRTYGLEPYRARADMMAAIIERTPDYWQTVYALKQALDPDDIIAPGRYNLTKRPRT